MSTVIRLKKDLFDSELSVCVYLWVWTCDAGA